MTEKDEIVTFLMFTFWAFYMIGVIQQFWIGWKDLSRASRELDEARREIARRDDTILALRLTILERGL